ncbi:MAG: hypothetical protein GEU73_14775 [Chloroflexi bacterium]|nr:hypothetical protein [Chloroflexota bacterium]
MQRQLASANLVRAYAIGEVALGLFADRSMGRYRELRFSLAPSSGSSNPPPLVLATDSPDAIRAVARGDIDLSTVNPSALLTMAYRGTGPFADPLPVRAIAVLPSWDRMAFAVAERTGLASLAEIRNRQYPLRVSVRADQTHATRFLIDEALAALGFSLREIEAWGGLIQLADGPQDELRLQGMRDGAIEAVFDEGITGWGGLALECHMRFLSIDGEPRRRMEGLGWPVGRIPRSQFPNLREEVSAASFSGWPLFTHASLPDDVAYRMCRALDAARPHMAWDLDGPGELRDLCNDSDASPLGVPLHPGAERYYHEHRALD